MHRPRRTQYEIIMKITGFGGFVVSKKYLVSSKLFGEKGVSSFAPISFGKYTAQKEKGG
jgi:hypothetical protein